MSRPLAIGIFVASVAVAFVLALTRQTQHVRLYSWFVVGAGVLLALPALSKPSWSLRALLIDESNKFTQPALICMGWFVMIVSGYLACAIWNVAIWKPDPTGMLPIAIKIPDAIWILTGIVGADLIADGIARQQQLHRTPTAEQAKLAAQVGGKGTRYERPATGKAQLSDLVTYAELGAHEQADPAAIQKLLFQITALVIYAVTLGRIIYLAEPHVAIESFPGIPTGLLSLLGMSTGVSITSNFVPHR